MLQQKTQLQIIDAIKTNDELVLKQLYINNYKKVELFILKNNGTMPQAKDIYQETFITVWKNIKEDKFSPNNDTAIQGYLFQIAKNKWTDYLRSSQYKRMSPLEIDFQTSEENGHHKIDFHEEENQRLAITMQAFGKLGAACKELLTRFYFSKKSLREIAQELAIDEASTRNKKYRCIQKLREIALSPNTN